MWIELVAAVLAALVLRVIAVRALAGDRGVRFDLLALRVIAPIEGAPLSIARRGRGFSAFWDRIWTGDECFDQLLVLEGTAARALAVLDAETRDALIAALDRGFLKVAAGRISFRVPLFGFISELRERSREALALAARLSTDNARVPEQLAAIAASDPLLEVRRSAAIALVRDCFGDRATGAVCNTLLQHEDQPLRVIAAIGAGHLRAIDAALSSPHRELRELGVAVMVRTGHQPALGSLIAALSWRPRDEFSVPLLAELARLAHPGAERAVIGAMASGDRATTCAAARALEVFGGAHSLRPLADELEILDPSIQIAARRASAAIRTRLERASASGALSLPGPDEGGGELSVYGEAGAVSVPSDQE